MKITKRLKIFIFMAYLIIPMISFALAAKEDYVGVDEGDEYIWEATYDEDVAKEVEEDLSTSMNTDLKGVKIEIKDIKSEDEYYSYDGVQMEIERSETEKSVDKNDWEDSVKGTDIIFEYDDDIYPFMMTSGAFFISTDVDWDDLQEKMNDDLEDAKDVDGKVEVVWNSGLKITLNYDDEDIKEIQYITIYNIKGVLSSYEMNYGGKNCVTVGLQGINKYITMQTIIIGAIVVIAIIGIFVVIVLIKRHR